MKIGITERGDASLDLSWIDKIEDMDGAIIISKSYNEDFENALLKYKDKIIYHCTCTGLGGTCLEPNVKKYDEHLNNLNHLIDAGFPKDHIVIRIDPIIEPYFANCILVKNYLDVINTIIEGFAVQLGVNRIRYSFIDMYEHVRKRIIKATKNDMCNNNFTLTYTDQRSIIDLFKNLNYKYPQLSFESCAEISAPENQKVGCISKKDFEILGLDINQCTGNANQRKYCLCCSAKTELLNNMHPCKNGCLYCYWK